MKIDRKKNTIRNFVWGVMDKLLEMLLPFVCRTLLIYYVGTEFLGLDSLFTSVLQMLNITELGVSSAIVFSMYKPIAQNDEDKICQLLNLYRTVYRVIGVVILCIGLAIIPFLPQLIKGSIPAGANLSALYLIFLGNTVLGYWLFAYKKALITAHHRVDVLSKINISLAIIKNVVQIVIVCLFHNYYLYLIVMPMCTILQNLYVAWITKKIFPKYICKGILDKESKKDIIQRIKGLMIQKICSTSRNSMDNVIISAFVGLTSVTIYGNYYLVLSSVNALMRCTVNAMSAGIGNGIAVDSPDENHTKMCVFDFMYMWLAGIATICMLGLYQPFMRLWLGEAFIFPEYLMMLFCVYFYSLSLGAVRSLYTTGAGLWWEGRYRSALEAITNIILNIVLGYFWGIAGVMLATIISIVAVNFGYGATIVFKHYFKNGQLSRYYLRHTKYAVTTLIAAVLVYILCEKVILVGIFELIVKLLICLFVPNVLYVVVYRRNLEFKEARVFVTRLIRK